MVLKHDSDGPWAPADRGDGSVGVLLLEAGGVVARRTEDALHGAGDCRVTRAARLPEALDSLREGGVDLVLVGTVRPYRDRIVAVDRIREAAPEVLILPADLAGFGRASGDGPEEVLGRPRMDGHWLAQALRYLGWRRPPAAETRDADERAFEAEECARVTRAAVSDAVLVADRAGNVTQLNPVAEGLTGWSRDEAVGRPLDAVYRIVDGDTRGIDGREVRRATERAPPAVPAAGRILCRRDGSECGIEDAAWSLHDCRGGVSGTVIVFREIHQSPIVTRRMAHLALHDALTGLPNRMLLDERLGQAMRLAQRHGQQVALLFVDLDNFKHINDTHGHTIGDRALQAVARRLEGCVRKSDSVSRQGGDEFVILLPEVDAPDDATRVADKLLAAFAAPVVVAGHALHIGMSVGVSVYPEDGDSMERLLQQADAAMYDGKSRARDPAEGSPPASGRHQCGERGTLERDLYRAVQRGELQLHYQPQIDLYSGRLIGLEALVRWQSPDHGRVPPDEFIPLAERTGLIVPIGHWVLQEACRQAGAWQRAGLAAPPVAINVSALEFADRGFADGVATVLQATDVAPAQVELEVTESVLMGEADASVVTLTALRAMGVRLAIDDFGAGYSSLSYLRRFPVDTIKVDRSFLNDVVADPEGTVILRSILGLGHSLGRRMVAEGVETERQLELLRAQRCEAGQGFHLGRPLDAGETERLLAMDGQRRPPRERSAG